MTDIERFIATVMDMRTAQKQFFKTRDRKWLESSKQLERDVDRWIEDCYKQGGDGAIMNKQKVNGILQRLRRIKREMFDAAAEFGDVDNYFMTAIEDISNRIGRIEADIEVWKREWTGAL